MQRLVATIFLSVLVSYSTWAQSLPSTGITLFDIDLQATSALTNPVFLTGFNMNGYNNQPTFFERDILYLTSDWQAKGNTDIIKLNLKANTILKVTDTEESEYSPTLTLDRRSFSTITVPVSQSDEAPQYLWKYPVDRSNAGSAISYDLDNVGYHTWLSSNRVALFLVGSPHTLVILNTGTGEITEVDKNIGRCFKVNDKNELVYVHKAAHNIWYLKTHDLSTGSKNIIGETKTGSEDFVVTTSGNIIMGQGSKVYMLKEVGGWSEISDLTDLGIKNISRIALLNNKIAFVHAS